ncbi:MAG: hypothetical protein Q9170_003329 [Blastenia crenularia]
MKALISWLPTQKAAPVTTASARRQNLPVAVVPMKRSRGRDTVEEVEAEVEEAQAKWMEDWESNKRARKVFEEAQTDLNRAKKLEKASKERWLSSVEARNRLRDGLRHEEAEEDSSGKKRA